MSPGQIAVAAASAVLLVSLAVLAASYLRRPSNPARVDGPAPERPVDGPTAPTPTPTPTAPPASAAEDLFEMFLDLVEDARRSAARRKLFDDLVEDGVPAEMERLRATFAPKDRAAAPK